MKQVLSAVAAALLFAACGSNELKVKSAQKNADGSTTTTAVNTEDLEKMAQSADEMTKRTEALKKLKPLTLEQLKALLPEELAGIKRTDYNTSSAMGYAVGEARYQKDDSTELKLMVYDCAGEAGAGWMGLTYWGALNFQQESQREYTKTVDFNGTRAIENFKKDDKESSFTYVANERLLVVLQGRNLEPAVLKEAARGLKLSL